MTEIEVLITHAKESLAEAQYLLQGKFYRGSVSSSYYTMFYAASALLLSVDVNVSSHGAVISYFGLHFVKTKRLDGRFGRMLRKAFDERDVADYRVFKPILPEVAQARLNDAKEFLAVVEDYLRKHGFLS